MSDQSEQFGDDDVDRRRPSPLSELIERDWIVVAIGDRTLTAAKPSLRLMGDGSLNGSTGVNRMFAQYAIDDGVLEVGAAGCTLMAGPPEAMHVESRFLSALQAGGAIHWSGDVLEIGAGNDRLVLRAEPAGLEPAEPARIDDPAVSGSVFYRERMAMPAGAVLRVSLLDVSKADAAGEVLASLEVADPGNVPIEFELTYDPTLIDDRGTYAVRATIDVDGSLWWTSTEAHLVLTNGRPATVDIRLTRAAR